MNSRVVRVKAESIDKCIAKYEGQPDLELNKRLRRSGYPFTAYRLNDNRYLLVMPHKTAGLLYESEEVLFEKLELIDV